MGFYFARDFRYSDRDVLALGPVFRFDLGNVLNPAQTLLIQQERVSIEGKNQFSAGGGIRLFRYTESVGEERLNPRVLQSMELLLTHRTQFLVETIRPDGLTESSGSGRLTLSEYSKVSGSLYLGFIADFPAGMNIKRVAGEPNLRLWFAFRD